MAAPWLKASKDRKSFRFVPFFAPLEDRTVPATFYVDPALASNAPGDVVVFNANRVSEVGGLTFTNTAAGAPDGAAFADFRTALDAAELNPGPDTILLATGAIPLDNSATTFDLGGVFVNSIPVSQGLTVRGDGAGATTVLPTTDTKFDDGTGAVADDLTSLFRVDGAAANLTASGFRVDGNGRQLGTAFAVQNGAAAAFDGVALTGIVFNPTAASTGTAVAGVNAASLTFANGVVSGYGRIGVQFINTPGSVLNSTVVGRGAGTFVNNGIEIDGGSVVTVAGSVVKDNSGFIAGGAQSSGLLLTDVDLLGGTTASLATVVGNTFKANAIALNVGNDAGTPDTSTLNAAYNTLVGNGFGAFGGSAAGTQNVARNWWGDPSGPFFPGGTGKGDAIDSPANLTYRPFLSYPTPRLVPNNLTDFNAAQASYLDQITTLNVAIDPVGPASYTTPQSTVSFTATFPTIVAANTTEPTALRPVLTAADFNVTAPAGATTTVARTTLPGAAADTYTITVSGLTGTNYAVTAMMPARAAINPATGVLNAASNMATITVNVPPVVPPPPAPNTPPTITGVPDQTVAAGGGATPGLAFTVNDAETAPAALVVNATSSNPAFTAVVTGTGTDRTVTVTGTAPGTATITLTVTDAAGATAQTAFAVTAPAVPVVPPAANVAPTITPSPLPDRTIPAGGSTGAIAFTVADDTTAPAAIAVTATSSNPAVTAVVTGTGANRTVTVSGATGMTGAATITLTATDAQGLSTSTAFGVTFTNAAPTIAGGLPNQSVLGTASTGPIPFTVADDNTPAADLVVTAVSSNPAVVPASSITLGGAGAARTIAIGNLPGVAGTSTITLTVRDADGAFTERTFTVTVQNRTRLFAVAADAGSIPEVQVFGADGKARFSFLAFESSFTGGVRVATADFDGDGTDDIVVAAGAGGAARIRVISGATGAELANFFAFEPSFRGGAYVAAGDIDGTGTPTIVVGAGVGGGPRVATFTLNGTPLQSFFAYEPSFRGGVTVAVGDVDKDGRGDIVTGAGPGGGPRVSAFSTKTGTPTALQSYFAFDPAYKGGVFVTAGTFGIAAAQGVNGNNEVRVQNGTKFIAYESTVTGGVRLGSFDIGGDGSDDILTAAGPGGGARIQGYSAAGQQLLNTFAFDIVARSGYFIG